MFGFLSTISDLWNVIADHRYAALAVIAIACAAAVWGYLPIAGRPLAKGLVVVAIGLACFDGGYSLRARQDRTADLRAELAASKALVVKQAGEAAAGARITDGLRVTLRQEEERGDTMDTIVEEFKREPPNVIERKSVIFRRAPASACADRDPGLGLDFARGLQRLDRATGHSGHHRR